ncbi:MAG: hypothetical protein ACXWJJ_05700 [Ramlibacter sp.]
MGHIASGLARRLGRWGVQVAVVGLAACGGGGGSDSSLATGPDLQADALRQTRSACMAAPGFTAQDPFVVNSLGAGSQQQVRFAGPLQDGGFALAWLSRTPADTLVSWRLQWQPFDASGQATAPPADLPYAEDVVPRDVAVLVQPSGRIIVAYAVIRAIDPANPFVVVNAVLARTFQDGTALPGVITIGSQTVNLRSRPGTFGKPVLAGFDDGSFLAGWHIFGQVIPQLWVQKVAADGTLVGDVVKIDSLGGLGPPREQLVTLSSGGWMAATPWRLPGPALQDYTLLTQVGVRHPLNTPDVLGVPGALPAGSVLLQDARGLVVASGPAQPGGAASLQQFNNGGNAAGQPDSLALTPIDAASLSTGEAALLASAGGTITLQRIGARGDPIGQPLATSVPSDALAGAVPGGGLVLTWTRSDADGSRVVAQLFTPSCSG